MPSRSFSRLFSTVSRRPLYLALMGAPGVGKGTFASRLGPHFQIPFISTGDLVRAEIKGNTAVGQQMASVNAKGGFVDDATIFQLLQKRLQNPDTKNGFLLDGYPRRVSQAERLAKVQALDLVVNIELEESVLIEKTISRRVCSKCGMNFNLADIKRGEVEMPPLLPKVPGKCDKCSSPLVQRSDDQESVVKDRLKLYWQETFPLLQYYEKQGNLMRFQVKKGLADLPQFIQQVEAALKK